jgi:hypothetical protein
MDVLIQPLSVFFPNPFNVSNRGKNEVVYSVPFILPFSTLNKIWQQFCDAVRELACLITRDIYLLSLSVWLVGPLHERWLTKIFVDQ